MKNAIKETERRRKIQMEYNKKHGIIPKTIKKSKEEILKTTEVADARMITKSTHQIKKEIEHLKKIMDKLALIEELERRMREAAAKLEFEKAAVYRDALKEIEKENKKRWKRNF